MMRKNKGFTLVELIVVIVILAILVGVTLGGIYAYVNKARINTDMHNAKVVQDTVFNALISDESMFKERYKFKTNSTKYNYSKDVNNGNLVVFYHWTDGGYLKYDNGWFFFDNNDERQKEMDWGYNNGPAMPGIAPEFPNHGAWTLFRILAKHDIIPRYPKSQSGQMFWLIVCFDENGMTKTVQCFVTKETSVVNVLKNYVK